ncbi:MAG: hypothetical protein CME71_10555 [Halobacteriovorax sp.]|nr:hypothetical protein [Halobacteriovorax sp.]|tara:strand:+ start:618 stop:1130 length:513 start_codon:yes stop_codon:yes gene_type:complete
MKAIIGVIIAALVGGLIYLKFFTSDFTVEYRDEFYAVVKTVTVDTANSTNQIEATFNEILQIYSPHAQTGMVRTIGINESEFTFQIGYLVKSLDEVVPESMEVVTIPAGTVAELLVYGPYTESYKSFPILSEKVKEVGLEVNGPAYQLFFNDPALVSEQSLKAALVFPVE